MKLPPGKRGVGFAISLLIIILLGYRVFWFRPLVAVTVVKKSEIQRTVHGPGTVQSKVRVAVSSKITGVLVKLYADQGDRVRKGQLLAELDSDQLRAQRAAAHAATARAKHDLAGTQANLRKSEADLSLAQSNYRRDSELFKAGVISEAALDTTTAALKVEESQVGVSDQAVAASKAELRQAESQTNAAEAEFAYTQIVAPMDGLLTVRSAEVGDTVSPGTPIFQMVDDQIWAASWIDETKVANLREGQKATIRLRSGRVFDGVVARLNKEADTVTRELEVDVKFATLPEPLVVGEETEVDIDTGRQVAPVIPLSAVMEHNGDKGVLVISNGSASFRPIKVGFQNGQRAAISEGLKEGEMIVINAAGIKPGKRIRPEVKPAVELNLTVL